MPIRIAPGTRRIISSDHHDEARDGEQHLRIVERADLDRHVGRAQQRLSRGEERRGGRPAAPLVTMPGFVEADEGEEEADARRRSCA